MNKIIKKSAFGKCFISLTLTLVLLATSVLCYATVAYAESNKDKIDDLKDKISEYEDKIESAEGELDSLKGDINQVKTYIEKLDAQIAMYQSQIDVYNSQIEQYQGKITGYETENEKLQNEIDKLNDKIEALQGEIDGLNIKIDEKYSELKELIRTNYINGETSALEVLLCSEDFSDYLTKVQFVSSLADYEKGLIDGISSDIEEINATVKEIDSQKAEIKSVQNEIDKKIAAIEDLQNQVEADKAGIEANQNEIEKKVNENQDYLSRLNDQSAEYNAKIAEYEEEIAQFDREIESLLQSNGSTGDGILDNSSGLICPLQYSGRYISSGFYRNSDGSYHGALDICVSGGTYGLAISAAEAGTVVTASYHWSYGNYVVIDHGNGLSTLYAHCSSLAVGAGQTVSKGQTIAYAGSTGNSSGPHVHFEVRVNGSRVNPLNYISV